MVDQDEPEHEGQHGEPSGGPLQWQGDEPQAPRYGLEDQHSQVIPLIIGKINTLTHRVMKKHNILGLNQHQKLFWIISTRLNRI